MRRGALVTTLLSVAAFPFVAWAMLRLGLLTPVFNLVLGHELSGATPLEVRVGSLRCDLFHFIEADDVMVLAPVEGAKIPLLTLNHLDVSYDLRPILRVRGGWRESLRQVRLSGLQLFVLRGPNGVWNLSALRSSAHPAAGTPQGGGRGAPMLPAFRLDLEDCAVVLNDEPRGFHSSIDHIRGSLDTRRLPLVSFALSGRTEDHGETNLALSGAWNEKDASLDGRLNLARVGLSSYLNYFLPDSGLRFTGGTASLGVRLRKRPGHALEASGRAQVARGALLIPGIKEPLSGVQGELSFDAHSLSFKGARAHFLGSDWDADGSIFDLKRPRFDLKVGNSAVPLAALSQQVRGLDLLDLSGTAAVNASLEGEAQAPRVDAFLETPWLGIAGFELQDVSISASLEGTRLTVRHLGGTLWGGEVDGKAGMDLARGGTLQADTTLTGALIQLARLRGRPFLPLDGLAQAHVTASGPLRSPDLDVDLQVDTLRLGVWKLGNLDAHASLNQKGLKGSFSTDQGLVVGTLAFSRPKGAASSSEETFHDTQVTLKQVGLEALARGLASDAQRLGLPPSAGPFLAGLPRHVQGNLDAQCSVEGPLSSPSFWMRARMAQGQVALGQGGSKTRPAHGLDLRINGFLGYHAGSLLLGRGGDPLRAFLGPRKTGFELQALGRYPLGSGAPGHLSLAMDMDMSLLDGLDFFRKSQGKLSGDLLVGGTMASPQVQGNLKLWSFSCEPAAYLAPVRGGSLEIDFHGQSMQLTRLQFRAPGLLTATGALDLGGGWEDLRGTVDVRTDAKGLRLEHWDSMGSGDLALPSLTLGFNGRGEPFDVAGRLLLSNAHIVYGGGQAVSAAPTSPFLRRPLHLDLRVGLGDNVLYEKLPSKTVDFSDPRRLFSDTLQSAEESLSQPGVSFRLAPTQQDFQVQGTVPDVDLRGELEVDRGRVTVLSNDFNIGGDQGPTFVRFEGGHADISGTAEARFNYTRYTLPPNSHPYQKTVEVYARISPQTQEEMDAAGLGKQFLNYQINFDSDPQIIADDPQKQQTAVLNLVVLGDPLVDNDATTDSGTIGAAPPSAISSAGTGDPDAVALLANAGLGAVTSGIARKELNALLAKFTFLSSGLDVVRVSPNIRYETVGAAPIQAAGAAATAASSSQYDIDWIMEFGKYIGQKLYASIQILTFGENSRDSVLIYNQANEAVQAYGVRTGLEYQVSRYRSFDVYGDFGCDDDLNPVAYDADLQAPFPSFLVQWRNTIPTDNYGTLEARRRRWESTQGGQP